MLSISGKNNKTFSLLCLPPKKKELLFSDPRPAMLEFLMTEEEEEGRVIIAQSGFGH